MNFDALEQVSYPGASFEVGGSPTAQWLQVRISVSDSETGAETVFQGRKWLLSAHMTRSEVVQTALKAVLAAVEHEARENFRYKGRAIYGPHFDCEALVELHKHGVPDVRLAMPLDKMFRG